MENCDPIDSLDEGVELSLRLGSNSTWIPITLIAIHNDTTRFDSISIGKLVVNESSLCIREYSVTPFNGTVNICGFNLTVENFIQFRWLQTSMLNNENMNNTKDVWSLDDVDISYHKGNNTVTLLNDSFDNPELK